MTEPTRCVRCNAKLNPQRAVLLRRKAGRLYREGQDPPWSRRVFMGFTCYTRWVEAGCPPALWAPWQQGARRLYPLPQKED
jgi:hypothetical protein